MRWHQEPALQRREAGHEGTDQAIFQARVVSDLPDQFTSGGLEKQMAGKGREFPVTHPNRHTDTRAPTFWTERTF